jgi:hypothetical protein
VRRSIPIQGCSGATSRGVEGLILVPRPEVPPRVEYNGRNRKICRNLVRCSACQPNNQDATHAAFGLAFLFGQISIVPD